MGLSTDSKFLENVDKYWNIGGDLKINLDTYLTPLMSMSFFVTALNVIKTSEIISSTYVECVEEVIKWIKKDIPDEIDVNKFIAALTLKYLIESGKYEIKNTISLEWDKYYYDLCNQVANNSKCFSRHVGAVLVRDKSIISTGYNGAPRGVPPCDQRWGLDKNLTVEFGKLVQNKYKNVEPEDYPDSFSDELINGKCPRQVLGFKSGEGLEWCVAGHAERNALIQAAREGICTKHSILYMNCAVPCTPCLIEIINAGVEEIVVTGMTYYDVSAQYILENSQLKARIYSFM